MTHRIRTLSAAIAAAALAIALSGCAAQADAGARTPDSTADTDEMPAELTTVKVGIQPPSSMAYLRLGVEEGFFQKRNLNLEFVDVATSDVAVTSLISNSVNFATINPPVLATAIDKGLPVRWAVAGVTSPEEVSDSDGIFVKPESDIQNWTNLQGKRVQVPCINCVSDLWVRTVVDEAGGDSAKVEFVVLASADAPAALEAGNVDAISGFSALVPVLQSKGYRSIGNQIAETATGQPIIPFGVNVTWAGQNRAVVNAFVAAAQESAIFADENIEEWRALLPQYYPQQVPNAAAAAKVEGHWRDCYFEEATSVLLDGIVSYGWVQKPLDVDDLFYSGVETKFC
ncbi:MAG: ABC transporter substrate-binding protein [Microbacterium sp.]|uniref:ABC transporter substrate-binding protein n=1 Tax=Microbacterium sp. TaxID=51671 RepID=UPI003F80A517